VLEQETADQTFTINHYLSRSGRDALPLDRGFLQRQTDTGDRVPGPLGKFVTRGREPALDQYLFMHAVASSGAEGQHDVRLPASAWARAIGAYIDPRTGMVEAAGLHLVSRNWRFLERLGLIGRERAQRRARVWLLADDGSGADYRRPAEGRRGEKLEEGERGFLSLPYTYWAEGWHKRLRLPGKAALLIGLSLGDGFQLPYGQAPKWYGISPKTAERGLGELLELGLLHRELHRRPDPESRSGRVEVYYYELLPPFGPRNWPAKSRHPRWAGPPKPRPPKARKRLVKVKRRKNAP
jgi:hypothetical protein